MDHPSPEEPSEHGDALRRPHRSSTSHGVRGYGQSSDYPYQEGTYFGNLFQTHPPTAERFWRPRLSSGEISTPPRRSRLTVYRKSSPPGSPKKIVRPSYAFSKRCERTEFF